MNHILRGIEWWVEYHIC